MTEDLKAIAAARHTQMVQQEKLVRTASVLGVNDRVGPYAIVPLTLVKWAALVVMESPYLPPFKTPNEGDTLALLWLLSPDYVPGQTKAATKARRKFYRQTFDFVPPLPPLWKHPWARGKHYVCCQRAMGHHAQIVYELREYIIETLQDKPHGGGNLFADIDYYSDEVAIAAMLARAYGGGLVQYLHLPLKFVFQALKENREHLQIKAGQPVVLHNPSDAAAGLELEAVNRALHESGVKLHPDAVSWFAKNNSQN
jgi:hypothetical protein